MRGLAKLMQALLFVEDGRTIGIAFLIVLCTARREDFLLATLLRVQIERSTISLAPRAVPLYDIVQVAMQRSCCGVHQRLRWEELLPTCLFLA